jgi:hypothetical protein
MNSFAVIVAVNVKDKKIDVKMKGERMEGLRKALPVGNNSTSDVGSGKAMI